MRWFDARLDELAPDAVLGYNNPSCPLLRRAAGRGYASFFIARSLANLFGPGRYVPDDVHLIANSPFTAAVAAQATGRQVEVVLPVVDFDAYRVERRERRYVTFVNPVPEKGVEVARAVARAMPEARFLFVQGRWADRSYAARRLAADNVEVWDHQDDMRSVYAVTDILLVPSQWLETFGRVVVEAQANGIPVVAADVGGLPFTVGEGGLLVRPKGEAAAYVERLRRLRADADLYARLSAGAVANSRRPELSPDRQVDRFAEIVEREAGAGERRRAPASSSDVAPGGRGRAAMADRERLLDSAPAPGRFPAARVARTSP
jgi:glycosyltransferase involved in cell wall biosynthesis